MNLILRRALVALLLASVALVWIVELQVQPFYRIPATIVACVVLFVAALRGGYAGVGLVGAAMFVMPACGPGALSLVVTSWLLGCQLRPSYTEEEYFDAHRSVLAIVGAVFFVGLLLAVARTLVLDFDRLLISSLLSYGGVGALYEFLSANAAPWHEAILSLAGYITAALAVSTALGLRRQLGDAFLRELLFGISLGALFAFCYGAAQLADLGSFFHDARGPFWKMIGRYNASLSDPNALGVIAALIIPLLLCGAGALGKISGLGLLFVAFWSGSRTMWLGLGLWIALWGHQQLAGRGKRWLFWSMVAAVMAVAVGVGHPAINSKLRSATSVPGLSRAVETLDWERLPSMVASRVVFSHIAVSIWQRYPVVGSGVGRFSVEQKTAEQDLGIDLGNWWDNANNFYLQVLAEQGVIGFSLTVLSLLLLATLFLHGEGSEYVRLSLAILPFLFFTGPHLFFPDVRYLAALLLGAALSSDVMSVKVSRAVGSATTTLLAVIAVFAAVVIASRTPLHPTRGLYQIERDPQLGRLVWSTQQAELYFCRPGMLEFRALHPDIGQRPVTVVFSNGQQRALRDTSWQRLDVPSQQFSFKLDRAWRPKDVGGGADARVLGLQLKAPTTGCQN